MLDIYSRKAFLYLPDGSLRAQIESALSLCRIDAEQSPSRITAFEALRTEAFGTAGDVAVTAAQSPAGGSAQIKGEEGGDHGFNPCLGWSDAADTECRNSP